MLQNLKDQSRLLKKFVQNIIFQLLSLKFVRIRNMSMFLKTCKLPIVVKADGLLQEKVYQFVNQRNKLLIAVTKYLMANLNLQKK